MTIGARVVIAALFKKMIVMRYRILSDTTTKLDVFVVLQAFDYVSYSDT